MEKALTFKDLLPQVTSIMEEGKQRIIQHHIDSGQMASGRTAASMEVTAKQDIESIEVAIQGRRFFQGLETGRKGGNVPRGFYYIIKQWAIDKRLQFETKSELCTFSYFTARKIAAEGTELYRQGGRSDIYSQEFKRMIGEVDSAVSVIFNDEIKTIQINGINKRQ